MAAAEGETDRAWVLVEQATTASHEGGQAPGLFAAVQYSRVLVHLVDGDTAAADESLAASAGSMELDARARHLSIEALVALVAGEATGRFALRAKAST